MSSSFTDEQRDIKRIHPSDVISAYEATKLIPMAGDYYDPPHGAPTKACAIGALAIASGFDPCDPENPVRDEEGIFLSTDEPAHFLEKKCGYSEEYLQSFIYAFDGLPLDSCADEERRIGYADGIAAARRVFGTGGQE